LSLESQVELHSKTDDSRRQQQTPSFTHSQRIPVRRRCQDIPDVFPAPKCGVLRTWRAALRNCGRQYVLCLTATCQTAGLRRSARSRSAALPQVPTAQMYKTRRDPIAFTSYPDLDRVRMRPQPALASRFRFTFHKRRIVRRITATIETNRCGRRLVSRQCIVIPRPR
jgi:hypothetical protein